MLILGWTLLVVGTGGYIITLAINSLHALSLRIVLIGVAVLGAAILQANGVPILRN